jgi:hypothetical protein
LGRLLERKNIGKVIIEPYLDENNISNERGDRHSSDTSGPDDEPNEQNNDL